MRLTHVVIRNFRALEDIETSFSSNAAVIVGPNAVGKTTLLEAVRLVKALLAPRTIHEPNQVLYSLGASTPFNPQQIILQSVANDVSKQVLLRCTFELTEDEMELLKNALPAIAQQYMFSKMGRVFAEPAEIIAAQSRGVMKISDTLDELSSALGDIRNAGRRCNLELTIDPTSGLNSQRSTGAEFVAFLDRMLPPTHTMFSYFPADRAIPSQDPAIQIGLADAANQLESHNSQPQLKYQRLKNTIFNAVITSEDGRDLIRKEFALIFDRILKGRRLGPIGVNQQGLLNITVEDVESGKAFGIDAMSSGEKGLILTVLLISRTLHTGGIVALDEPELHLNPAVCKDILSFLVEQYANPRQLQLLICSHSPEILGAAFERDDCPLYHIRSGRLITPIRRQDLDEVGTALKRLGISATEALLYNATVFVEGEHDSDILAAGFEVPFRRCRFQELGGRGEVEKEIAALQEAESHSQSASTCFFIFDRDEAPSNLRSTPAVKIMQWSRRCLENYLIDIDVLTDLLKDRDLVGRPVQNVGELQNLLKTLAMLQIPDLVAKEVYNGYAFENPGLRAAEIRGKSVPEISNVLSARLGTMKDQLGTFDEASWRAEFVTKCNQKKLLLDQKWDAKWPEECDGKRLFKDLQRSIEIRQPLNIFKRRVIMEMQRRATENWRTMESLLKELLDK